MRLGWNISPQNHGLYVIPNMWISFFRGTQKENILIMQYFSIFYKGAVSFKEKIQKLFCIVVLTTIFLKTGNALV